MTRCELLYLVTDCTDPVRNLALEALLLETVQPGQCLLYLWQNRNTVVIGRNQNSRRECRLDLLEADGGRLVRRLSGGGAVYHDLENLNFTFLARGDAYDLDRQLQVVLQAVQGLGVPAEKTGRNDLTAEGRKFSGNAFYRAGDRRYHHGTLLLSADGEKMARYLAVDPEKLRSKGVASVRARVCGLREYVPGLTVEQLRQALIGAFGAVYGKTPRPFTGPPDTERLRALEEKFGSEAWRFGREPKADCTLSGRWPWGGAEICLTAAGGRVVAAAVYTDAMDAGLAAELETALVGLPFAAPALAGAVRALAGRKKDCGERRAMALDIAALLEGMDGTV
ncbi:lipoate--protein ligase [Anaerofilum sp. BX8]|uniref:lipoate--protein ligase n=1 Tax=Anaerofilum hominis TaxID=2763016 RepID=A0A923I8B8_9FIRM|nr:lipoate--protein ligase [Anaerofilum hominis]MBC5580108.1 lipoate--protein ligase [Anaerofilum hominis]